MHPSAEVLHAQATEVMPGISLRTIYQTLNDLAVLQIEGLGGFQPDSARLVFSGTCQRCADAAGEPIPQSAGNKEQAT